MVQFLQKQLPERGEIMGSGNGVDSVSVVIQKYGGSSVATPEKIKAVAGRIGATKDLGHDLVVVVSAMGNTTDELLALAKQVSPQPQRRVGHVAHCW